MPAALEGTCRACGPGDSAGGGNAGADSAPDSPLEAAADQVGEGKMDAGLETTDDPAANETSAEVAADGNADGLADADGPEAPTADTLPNAQTCP
ncbi:MAG: hypothetical protein HY898_18160 [Deltaproteobacteria bacterium]|nr:hypothetical protein [Deltaproteobacteria bacterium]